ncbi:CRISPR-associated protein Csx16 [Pseudoalteromonas sp. SS15]|uniref:CRISPR-associated protein Csx16 n=1 Tax=Pseudoalteromonas sp. SS15 TaxID=3139393 RepID=UPI003BAA3892
MRYLVTRHPGAIEWCRQQGLECDQVIAHLNIALVQAGDEVIGTLPIPMAAELIKKGGKYFHLTVPLTADLRGRELSAERMTQLGCSLTQYHISRLHSDTC